MKKGNKQHKGQIENKEQSGSFKANHTGNIKWVQSLWPKEGIRLDLKFKTQLDVIYKKHILRTQKGWKQKNG